MVHDCICKLTAKSWNRKNLFDCYGTGKQECNHWSYVSNYRQHGIFQNVAEKDCALADSLCLCHGYVILSDNFFIRTSKTVIGGDCVMVNILGSIFHLSFEGNPKDDAVIDALKELQSYCDFVYRLGSFREGTTEKLTY